jgi:hypothetical protein
MLLAGGMTEKEIESLRQIWLAQFTLFISCWTVRPRERLVSLCKQHQLAFPRHQYEDGPTCSRFFLNQLDVSGVASFELSVYQAARHCSPLPWWWWPRVCLCWTICSNAFLGLRLLTDRAFPVLFFAAVHLFSRSSCFCVAEQPNHLAEGLKIVNLT